MIRINREADVEAQHQSFVGTLQSMGFSFEAYLSTMEQLVEAGYVAKKVEASTTTYVLTELGASFLKSLPDEWDRKLDEVISDTFKQELERVMALHLLAEYGGLIVQTGGKKMVDFPQVLLEDAREEFRYVMTVASHENVKLKQPEKVYPQPHVYITTHYVCMRAAGWKDTDFDTLMTISGAGLLFAYDPNELMPKYAHLWLDVDKRIAEATGFGWEWVKFKDADEAWRLVKETIDSGRPAKGHFWEDMLFVGYHEATRKEDRKVFVMGDPFPGPGEWWTWKQFEEWARKFTQFGQNEIGRHTGKVPMAAKEKIALQVLKDAVAWSKSPPDAVKNRFPHTLFGLAAIQAYAEDVADVEAKPKGYFKESGWLGCHAINPQWTTRNSTAAYLRSLAAGKTFPEKVNTHLLAAAGEYKTAYTAWQEFYRQLGYTAPKNAWDTRENRLAGAAAVREALRHEQTAIKKLEKALAVIGQAKPEVNDSTVAPN